MTAHWFTYCLEEALASLQRQRVSVMLSVLTIGSALLVLGGFLLVTVNLDRAVSKWSSAAEFSVYLADDISDEQRVALEAISAIRRAGADIILTYFAKELARRLG